MKSEHLVDHVSIPEGCSVTFEDYTIRVKGAKGELDRKITTPNIKVSIEDNSVVFRVDKPSKREKRMINTYKAHLKNQFRGVTQGHIYKMKVCSGHFPMTVALKNNILEVKNFLGEKVPRTIKLRSDIKLNIQGDIISIESTSKEAAGNTASSIEKLTRRSGFDKRIFQDGIYIIDKDGKAVA